MSKLPTRAYIEPMELGEEIAVELQKGKTLGIKLVAVGELNSKEGTREVRCAVQPPPAPARAPEAEPRTLTIDHSHKPSP